MLDCDLACSFVVAVVEGKKSSAVAGVLVVAAVAVSPHAAAQVDASQDVLHGNLAVVPAAGASAAGGPNPCPPLRRSLRM